MCVTLIAGQPALRLAIEHDEHDDAVDRELVGAARSDPAAFAQLYRRHIGAVFAHAYRLCGSKEVAEEATSATFERALRAMPGFTWQGGGVRPWLLRIAGHEVAGWYRTQSRATRPRGQMALRDLAGPADGGGDGVGDEHPESAHTLAAMRAALSRLPDRYRQAIELRYLGGLSAADAAEAIGCTKPALAVVLHRALGALRKEMAAAAPPAVRSVPSRGGRR